MSDLDAQALLESAPDATVIVDARGQIEFANALAVAMFGYTRAELIGQSVELLVPERHRAAHPGLCASYLADPRARPMALGAELHARRKDGSQFPVEITLSSVATADGVLVSSSIRDITERKRAEHELARLAEAVEHGTDAVVSIDLEAVVRHWNPGAERLFGYSTQEALGRSLRELTAPGDEPAEQVARMLAGEGAYQYETRRRRKDGTIIDVLLTVSPWRASGQVVGVTGIALDLSARKRAERERAELLAASIRAESANRAKSEFLARMSHELRTPLNSIIGFTQLVELDGLTPAQNENAGYALRAAEHLLELITEVLQLAKIEAGQVTISPEPVSLPEALAEALALIAPQAAEHELALSAEHDELQGGGFVRADRQRLKQVLLNVLSNAVKYNRPGGRIDISCATLESGRVRTRIADTGIGIAAEHLARLFEPFERLGAEHTEVEGTGLGLALSKGFVEAMGGKIEVSSQHGIGTAVAIELAGASPPAVEGRRAARARELPELDGAQRTLLYVEDNLANLTLVQRILGRYRQIELIPAMQGSIGLELAREHRLDLIVLDLHLPDIPGAEVLKRLKAEPATREIPVIVLSADASPHQSQRVVELGAAEYLTKPLDVATFLESVARGLGERPARSEPGDR